MKTQWNMKAKHRNPSPRKRKESSQIYMKQVRVQILIHKNLQALISVLNRHAIRKKIVSLLWMFPMINRESNPLQKIALLEQTQKLNSCLFEKAHMKGIMFSICDQAKMEASIRKSTKG